MEAKRERVHRNLASVALATLLGTVAGLCLVRRPRPPLTKVMTALREIQQGRYDVKLNRAEGGELGDLQGAVIDMAQALSSKRQDLENQIGTRTRDLENAIELANQADDEKRRLIAQGNVLVEEERRRIAMEIHDHLNASLLFVKLEAQRIASLATKLGPVVEASEIESVAQRISLTVADLYTAARDIIKQLRPEVIDILGLKGALQEMVRTYQLANPGCRFALRVQPSFPNLNPALTIAAYRVIQEALSNVVKHANASHATVTLWPNPKRDGVCLTIEDDGVGFNARKRTSTGIGLIGMRERVIAVGGTVKVASAPDSGTKITIELPTQKL